MKNGLARNVISQYHMNSKNNYPKDNFRISSDNFQLKKILYNNNHFKNYFNFG